MGPGPELVTLGSLEVNPDHRGIGPTIHCDIPPQDRLVAGLKAPGDSRRSSPDRKKPKNAVQAMAQIVVLWGWRSCPGDLHVPDSGQVALASLWGQALVPQKGGKAAEDVLCDGEGGSNIVA